MRQAIEAAGLDALVLRLPENVLLLSGHWPMIGAAFLLFPLEGRATCLMPDCYQQEANASLENCDVIFFAYGGTGAPPLLTSWSLGIAQVPGASGWRRIGVEDDFEAVAPSWNTGEAMVPAASYRTMLENAFPAAQLVDATPILTSERLIKTEFEIQRLGIASEISRFGLDAFQQAVQTGVSGVELVSVVEQACMVRGTGYRGAVRVRAFAQVTTGNYETSQAQRPNVISTTRRMEDGDSAVVELGVVADGYWADRTRVGFAGTARDEQLRILDIVIKAQEAAIAIIRPGIPAAEVDRAARTVIADAGYGDFFPHITGHGLGFGYHEPAPILGPHSSDRLERGMMTSVEPGIYTPSAGGCRIEDDVIVTESGATVLGVYPKAAQNASLAPIH